MADLFWVHNGSLPPMDISTGDSYDDEAYNCDKTIYPLYGRGRSIDVVIEICDDYYDSGFYDYLLKCWWCDELGDWVDEIKGWCDATRSW